MPILFCRLKKEVSVLNEKENDYHRRRQFRQRDKKKVFLQAHNRVVTLTLRKTT